MRKTMKGTKGNRKGSLSALLGQEEKLGRKDSLLEKGVQHRNTTQRKQMLEVGSAPAVSENNHPGYRSGGWKSRARSRCGW